MRTFTCSLITLFLLISTFGTAQLTEYEGDICGSNEDVTQFCPNLQLFDISVSGEGVLGENNRGILEVFVDLDQIGGWDGEMYLISPDGDEYLLANFFSFPGYTGPSSGEILDVSFGNCASYPDTNTGGNPSGEIFFPMESFAELNSSGGSADGTWSIGICQNFTKDSGLITVYCVSVSFGAICPEIEEAITTPADCGQTNGSVEFVSGGTGYCGGSLVYSLDGIDFESTTTFSDLPAGSYTGYIAYLAFSNLTEVEQEEMKDKGSINKALLPGDCITDFEFTIEEALDVTPPSIDNCPVNQTVILDESCFMEFFITDPSIIDDCGVDFDNSGATITTPNGDVSSAGVSPGNTFPYTWNAPGNYIFDWFVTDFEGNQSTCQTVVTILDETPPFWENNEVVVDIECGVDDVMATVDQYFGELLAFDACGGLVTFSAPINVVTPQCGGSEWSDWFYTITDESGNVNTIQGEILINVNDNLPPTLTGVPSADITISCGDDFPAIPEVGVDVFADDLCAGDISSLITVSSSISLGDCLIGEPIEIHSYSYSVDDGCGNVAIESFSVLIFNDQQPVWDAPYSATDPIDITLECGVDDLPGAIAANTPTAQGCNGPTDISISALQEIDPCPAPSNAEDLFYTYQATDECNNQNFTNVFIHYLDTQAPILNGIPADVTVNCNESLPVFPDVTAMDVCEGDVTSLIEYNFEITASSCDFQQNSFVELHTWTAFDLCGNNISALWTVTVFNDEEVDLGEDLVACTGEVVTLSSSGLSGEYAWSTGETTANIDVDQAGEYFVTVTGLSGCCSVDNVTVGFEDFPMATATGGVLDCSGTDIQIFGNSSVANVTYSWTGPGGFTSSEQNPMVSQAGTYNLTIFTSAGCDDSIDAIVEADTDAPDITTAGGTIDCNNSMVTIMGSSTTSGVSYAWTGPNGFTSDMPSPDVTVAGEYNLVITAPNGCVADGVAIVVDDLVVPTASTTGGTINCDNSSVTLVTTSSDASANFSWSGPNGFSSNEQNPAVDNPGTYNLIVSSSNGCTNMAVATVNMDTSIPDLNATGGTISCASSTAQLTAVSNTAGVSYLWSGPNGFTNNTANPVVDVAGNYTITVEATNGCDSTLTVVVNQDIANPIASVPNNVITCAQPTVTLMPTASDGVTFAWTGPGGFTSSEENPVVNMAGMYSLVVTSANGCTATASSTITQDNTPPSITASNNLVLNCANPTAQIIVTTTNSALTYVWTGPGGFTSMEQSPTVSTAGMYTVVATAANGCSTMASSNITEDTALPNASALGGELNCGANTVALSGSSTTPGVSYGWVGPNSFSSTAQNPSVGSPGTYTLTVTAANGCTATATAEVNAASDLPNISASGGEMNCIIFEVQLMGNSTTAGASFTWTGPGGFTTTDQNPVVTEPGEYTFIVIGPNDCISETDVMVTMDNSQPAVAAIGTQLSCNQSSGTLTSSSSTANVTFQWTGPNGFSSTEQNPAVTLPGEYFLVVTGENGCSAETSVQVTVDEELPVASLDLPEIDCDNNEIFLSIATSEMYTYNWTFEGNTISSAQEISISQAGTYTVDVIATNGCSVRFEYVLEEDLVDLLAEIETVDATSTENGSATLEVLNYDNITSIVWDNGEVGASANDLTAGTHTVIVTTNFGCEFIFEFDINMSTAIDEIDFIQSFNVYPTVSSDFVNLEIEFERMTNPEIYLYSTQGELIQKINVRASRVVNERIDLQALSAGVYILSVRAEGKIKTNRIVKM